MGVTRGYNHRLRLRNTLPSSTKGRLQIFPILNCLLFEGMFLHTGMYCLFFFSNIIFIRGWRWGSFSVEAFVCAVRSAKRRCGCSSKSVHGRAQPAFYPGMKLVPKQKTDWYSELAEPARTDVRVCNRHKHSIRLTKINAWQCLSHYCDARISCMIKVGAQK